ncbi:MAG: selenide, water dikinase SelD [Deltaproteobacteria bacterium RIFCSPHIGHO2_02_FULL_40_11]|nr:MAG: selenide, water dikinase SelD [Deltaproteobacteria bacterium RIFCSPHIGHO2_02_FULL_40_11]
MFTSSFFGKKTWDLTQRVKCAGCASKFSPTQLAAITKSLKHTQNENVLVGTQTIDDAGVYRLSKDLALVQTVDFFTPIVDDPFMYGQISAANALSDIYAMGGTPLTALNICAFPKDFPNEVLEKILQGGHQKAKEAGCEIVGGHTVQDKELKYGMAITGTIHPEKIYTNQGAKPGDSLLLTKPLGTGILTTAIKRKKATAQTLQKVCHWMAMLNQKAVDVMASYDIHACTDITGFGLTGHSMQMANASQVSFNLHFKKLPIYEEAFYFVGKKCITGADKTNRLYTQAQIEFQNPLKPEEEALIFDAQTSGGLFISLPHDQAPALKEELKAVGYTDTEIVGEVIIPSTTPKIIIF